MGARGARKQVPDTCLADLSAIVADGNRGDPVACDPQLGERAATRRITRVPVPELLTARSTTVSQWSAGTRGVTSLPDLTATGGVVIGGDDTARVSTDNDCVDDDRGGTVFYSGGMLDRSRVFKLCAGSGSPPVSDRPDFL